MPSSATMTTRGLVMTTSRIDAIRHASKRLVRVMEGGQCPEKLTPTMAKIDVGDERWLWERAFMSSCACSVLGIAPDDLASVVLEFMELVASDYERMEDFSGIIDDVRGLVGKVPSAVDAAWLWNTLATTANNAIADLDHASQGAHGALH